ncbi:unannotated protein [freshwater metagenome]|uniref:Unannotated protein n=1 Tax=freshwater metagenome TaxID=449393 RepID=A0A6J7FGH0_9ZZZZ|nr:hypothetical protein [Actinomycetota bacterium]
MPSPTRIIPSPKPKLDAALAAALGVPTSARDRQVADAVMRLVPDDEDRDRMPNEVAAWLRHIVDLIAERDWQTELANCAMRVADDAISDIYIDDVEEALATIAPVHRATGRAATTALRRVLPPFCETLLHALLTTPAEADPRA